MLVPFTKAHGTGNSFIILYLPECPDITLNKHIIQFLCQYKSNDSIDGLLAISNDERFDFKMDYYNNDGTWETMCANGARCAGLLLYKKNIIAKKASFISGDGPHDIIIHDENNIEVSIFPPEYTSDEIIINELSGFSINSGAKHFVVEVSEHLNWYEVGKQIRFSKYFSPHGTNVNFVQRITNDTLKVITYEKGIEQIMKSCGSGSVAAAYHMYKKYNLNNKLNIEVEGGQLTVHADNDWNNVWLTGPAKIIENTSIEIGEINEIGK